MTKIEIKDIKTFEQLKQFAKKYGYKTTVCGSIRQNHWQGFSFNEEGEVKYMANGLIICKNLSCQSMAIMIKVIGKDKE